MSERIMTEQSRPHSRTAVVIILLFIMALATFLRFWQLAQMPPGLYHDEAYNGLDALSLVQGKTFPQFYEGWELYQHDAHAERPAQETRWPLFFEGNYGREPVHIYLMALSIKLLGATPFAIRAVPALFGILAVFTTFLAAKAVLGISDWRLKIGDSPSPFSIITPLVAAFTVAILFPAIHFSRFGLRAMVFVPVETLSVYCFWKGMNTVQFAGASDRLPARHTLWFLASGVLLGLGLYIYAAARLFPLLFVGFALFLLWRERPLFKQIWWRLGLMAGAALVVALPLLIFFWQYPYFFIFRIAYVSNKGKGVIEGRPYLTWLQNIWRIVGGLFWQGETHLRHNLPARPYLDIIQAALFVVGVVRTTYGVVRTPRYALRTIFLLLWLVTMLLPTIMSGDAPHFGRMTGVVPVVAIFIGLGFEWIGKRLSVISKRPPLTVYGLLITVLLISAFWTGYDYFIRYANHPQIADDFYLPEWQMGQFAAQMPETASIYLAPTQEELATLYFSLADPERLQNVAGGAIPAGIPGEEVLFLLRPSQSNFLTQLQNTFPDGITGKAEDSYTPFTIPADTTRNIAANQSSYTFADKIELAGWDINADNKTLTVTLIWQANQKMAIDYTAFVQLLGTDNQPLAQLDRQPAGHPTSSWHPDEMIIDYYTMELPDDLAPDTYTLITGFYELPSLTPLGETAVLGDWTLEIKD